MCYRTPKSIITDQQPQIFLDSTFLPNKDKHINVTILLMQYISHVSIKI